MPLAEISLQPLQRLLDQRLLLAEGKAHKGVRRAALEESRQRDQRHPGLADQPLAKGEVLFIGQLGDAGGEEVGAFAGQHVKAQLASGPPPAYRGCLCSRAVSASGKSISWVRPCATPSCSAGEVVKVRNWCALATTRDQLARARHPAHFPAGQREDLARRADPHHALAHARQRGQGNMRRGRRRPDAHRPRRRSPRRRFPAPPCASVSSSSRLKTRPAGLCGELIRMARGLRRRSRRAAPLRSAASPGGASFDRLDHRAGGFGHGAVGIISRLDQHHFVARRRHGHHARRSAPRCRRR